MQRISIATLFVFTTAALGSDNITNVINALQALAQRDALAWEVKSPSSPPGQVFRGVKVKEDTWLRWPGTEIFVHDGAGAVRTTSVSWIPLSRWQEVGKEGQRHFRKFGIPPATFLKLISDRTNTTFKENIITIMFSTAGAEALLRSDTPFPKMEMIDGQGDLEVSLETNIITRVISHVNATFRDYTHFTGAWEWQTNSVEYRQVVTFDRAPPTKITIPAAALEAIKIDSEIQSDIR